MTVTVRIDGQDYTRFTRMRIVRSLKNVAAGFDFEIPGELDPPILPFQACTISEGSDKIVTGYVDTVEIHIDAHSTRSRVLGRSKTGDLVDCMLAGVFPITEFVGSKLDAIAKAITEKFGVATKLENNVDVGEAFQDQARFELSETAYAFLERLARQRGVLLTDDADGNLVLTGLGTKRAPADLAMKQGGNVFRAGPGRLDGRQRFSQYSIYAQGADWTGIGGNSGGVINGLKAISKDGGVSRFRPWAGIAEAAMTDQAEAQKRADWEARHRSGQAVQAVLYTPEWRAQGRLWQVNELARCEVPRLKLDQQYLIGAIQYFEDSRTGRFVALTVAPSSAYEPGVLKVRNTGSNWEGIVNVAGPP